MAGVTITSLSIDHVAHMVTEIPALIDIIVGRGNRHEDGISQRLLGILGLRLPSRSLKSHTPSRLNRMRVWVICGYNIMRLLKIKCSLLCR